MLATGNAPVTEVANRQVAERPEAREPDASGSPFAGLMAHWIQPQSVAKPPVKAQAGGSEASHRKATTTKESAGSPAATPEAPSASDAARSAPKPGAPPAAPRSTAPADAAPSAPTSADDTAASASVPAGAASTSAESPVTPSATVAILPDPASLVPAPDQAMATLAALALGVLQSGGMAGQPSARTASPGETALVKGAPATVDPTLDPVPPQASTSSQAPTTSQAVLAGAAGRSRGKDSTKELQAALEALETPQVAPHLAAPAATKTGPDLPAPTALQEPAGLTPAKASVPASAAGLDFEASQVDPAAARMLPVPHAADGFPAEAAPVPTRAPLPADSSAMAAVNALPRLAPPAPATGSAPAAPPPNTPVVLPTPMVTQVEGSLRWMLKGGSQEAQLQLHPDSLGQVTIHLRVEGGEVHARLWVTEASSVQAVQEGRPHLEASLKEQGLQLGSFDLQQGHRPFQEAPATPTYPGRPVLDLVTAGQEAPAPPLATILNSRHIELYA